MSGTTKVKPRKINKKKINYRSIKNKIGHGDRIRSVAFSSNNYA